MLLGKRDFGQPPGVDVVEFKPNHANIDAVVIREFSGPELRCEYENLKAREKQNAKTAD